MKILESWNFGYTKVLCKYFVLKTEGKKQLAYGLVAFSNEDLSKFRDIHVETESIIAGQQVFKLTKKYYKKITETLTANPHILHTRSDSFSLQLDEGRSPNLYFNRMTYPNLNPIVRSPYLSIGAGNRPNFPHTDVIDIELRLLDEPYENHQDLFFALGLPQDLINSAKTPSIDIIATTPLSGTDIKLENREDLSLKFFFPVEPNKEKFFVGMRFFKKDQTDPRCKYTAADFEWKKEGKSYVACKNEKLENVEVVKVFPSYDGHNVASHTVFDPNVVLNVRSEVHAAFYEGQEISNFLFSQDATEFEYGVSALLHYLRLSSHRYSGVKKLTEGPDIIAFSYSGHIYVVECTIAAPDHKGKLFKLHTRAEKLRNHYRGKGFNPELVRPVLFTNLPNENTSADRATAANYKISLITKEDILTLLSRVNNPPNDAELYQAALQAIPAAENDNQLKLIGT